MEASLPLSGVFCLIWHKRFAKGIGSAVHLIHRGAVPLPLEGKDLKALEKGKYASLIERPY